jgi:hypothetical protein
VKKNILLLGALITINAFGQTNIVKLNLSSLPLNTYNLQYEKVLNKRFSFNLGLNYRHQSVIPFPNLVEKAVNYVDNRIDYVSLDKIKKQETEIGLMSITPEIRIYFGKKNAPFGTYFGVFAKYNYYPSKVVAEMNVPYKENSLLITLPINTKVDTKTAGIILGHQFRINKRFTLDWNIIGGHFGQINPYGESNIDLSSFDDAFRERIRTKIIETFKIDLNYLSVNVTDTGVKIEKIQKLPFINLRGFGFNLGYHF